MSLRSKLHTQWLKRRPKSLSATKIIAIAFALIILTGALLLSLPAASRDGVSCGFRPALFTATSATCVTGLVLYDTFTQWYTVQSDERFSQIMLSGIILFYHFFLQNVQ